MKPSTYSPPSLALNVELDLSKNEGKAADQSLFESIEEAGDLIRRYPDTAALRERLASRLGVRDDQVLVTAGGDDALFRCFLARLRLGSSAVTTKPTFEMIPNYASQIGVELIEVDWWEEAFPTAEVVTAGADAQAVFVVSPNNPTGSTITEADLVDLSRASRFVVLDAAYAEFADVDLTAAALELDNVVVVRTLSKAFGLAGLRVGYLVGSDDLIGEISAFGSPFSVSALSAAIASEALDRTDGGVARYVNEIRSERAELGTHLDSLGVRTLPSQGNFVLVRVQDETQFAQACAAFGVGIRHFPGRSEMIGWVRVTLPGNTRDFGRLKQTLEAVLAPDDVVQRNRSEELAE